MMTLSSLDKTAQRSFPRVLDRAEQLRAAGKTEELQRFFIAHLSTINEKTMISEHGSDMHILPARRVVAVLKGWENERILPELGEVITNLIKQTPRGWEAEDLHDLLNIFKNLPQRGL